MPSAVEQRASKVPEVTLVFWVIKVAATTLGETGGDTVTMTLDWGYLAGTAIFLLLLVALIAIQIAAQKFHPFLYWATIVASTTAGTTMADFADRSLGVGYAGGSSILFVCLMATLGLWYWSCGSLSVTTVSTPKVEAFYWAAIPLSQTLGTALGDWTADDTGLGYQGGALVFAAGLAALAAAYYLDQCLAGVSVLGGLHRVAAARRHGRRFSRQAGQRRRARLEPSDCVGGHCRVHRRLPPPAAAEGRAASGPIRNRIVSASDNWPALTLASPTSFPGFRR